MTVRPDGTELVEPRIFIGGHPEWDFKSRMIGRVDDKLVLYDTLKQEIVETIGGPEFSRPRKGYGALTRRPLDRQRRPDRCDDALHDFATGRPDVPQSRQFQSRGLRPAATCASTRRPAGTAKATALLFRRWQKTARGRCSKCACWKEVTTKAQKTPETRWRDEKKKIQTRRQEAQENFFVERVPPNLLICCWNLRHLKVTGVFLEGPLARLRLSRARSTRPRRRSCGRKAGLSRVPWEFPARAARGHSGRRGPWSRADRPRSQTGWICSSRMWRV